MLVKKNFQTWLLIGWQHSCQPIRSHVNPRKYLSTNIIIKWVVWSICHCLGLCHETNGMHCMSFYILMDFNLNKKMVTQIPCVLLFWPVTSVHKGPPWCCNPEEWVWSNVGRVYISSYFNLAQDPVLWACSSKLSCSYLDCGHLIHFQDQHLACQLPGATLNMATSAGWQLEWNRLNTVLKWKCHRID